MIDETAVIKDIAPDDQMLNEPYGRDGYFFCGRSALECIKKTLEIASIPLDQVNHILDLPSGHGRVLRYLKVGFPHAEITACDLQRDAVDYCSSTFGAIPVYSCDDPESIALETARFDLIWVGSLFTHLDVPHWPRFLAALRNTLRPGGLLLFTTCGREAYRRMVAGTFDYGIAHWQKTILMYRFERAGFGYVKYPGSDSYYGLALAHPAWVTQTVSKLDGLRLVHVSEAAWAKFQDVFGFIRKPGTEAVTDAVSKATYLRHSALDWMNPRLRVALWRMWDAWRS